MPLLPDEIRVRLPPIRSKELEADPFVFARFFLPGTAKEWYVIAGEKDGEDVLLFGFATATNDFRYFLLSELLADKSPLGQPVEHDDEFVEGRLTDVVAAPDP